ncbi:sensor histidine kinase [Nocardia sp. X0981]
MNATPVTAGPAALSLPALSRGVRVFLSRSLRSGPEPAVDRVVRRLSLVIGIGGTVAAVFELPEIVLQQHEGPLIRTALTVAMAFGMLPVLAVVSVVAGPRLIRAVAGTAAVGYLTAMTLATLYHYETAQDPGAIWAHRLIAVGVLAAALAWRPVFAGGYLVIASAIPGIALFFMFDDTSVSATAGRIVRHAGLCLLVLWCVVHARAAGERVDRESAVASERAAKVAGTAARERERARFAALIHDAVLSTLLDASRTETPSPALRAQAVRTLERLDAMRVSATGPEYLDVDAAIGFLRSAVREVHTELEFKAYRGGNGGDLRLPVAAAGALAAALAEAVRNSLRHAGMPGRPVRRTVTVTVGAGGLRVVMRDDGVGFDRSAVPADRLGISVSVLGRMRQLAGGAGFVESEPGEGTTVTLMWGSSEGDTDA